MQVFANLVAVEVLPNDIWFRLTLRCVESEEVFLCETTVLVSIVLLEQVGDCRVVRSYLVVLATVQLFDGDVEPVEAVLLGHVARLG